MTTKLAKFKTAAEPIQKGRRLSGLVVKKSGDKTVAVQVTRITRHPLYLKKMVRTKKYLVHDPAKAAKAGDMVTIGETRPRSRRKRWRLVTVDQRAGGETE